MAYVDSGRDRFIGQLRDQAEALSKLDGCKLLLSVLDTCMAMLRVGTEDLRPDSLDEDDTIDLRCSCEGMFDLLNGLYGILSSRKSAEVDTATDELCSERRRLDDLQREFDAAQAKAQKTRCLIDSLEQEIKAQPEEARQLRDEYRRNQNKLDDLKNAHRKYGPKLQESLKCEIDDLASQVEDAQRECKTLKTRRDELERGLSELRKVAEAMRVGIDSDEKNSLRIASDALERLAPTLTAFREVRTCVESLEADVHECAEIRDRYTAWFEMDHVHAQALIEEVEPATATALADRPSLRAVLVRERVDALRKDLELVKEAMGRVDKVVEEAMQALEEDQDRVAEKARP